MILSLLFFVGCWCLWRLKTPGLERFDLLMGWLIKMVASGIFFWVYTHYYGTGTLTADPGEFMRECKILAEVADHSWINYFRFLFGLETSQLVDFYLSDTMHWTVGDTTLINDSSNVVRVNSLIYLLSNGDLKAHLLIVALISLLGFREAYMAVYFRTTCHPRLVWLLLIILPSVLFWTASMLKEPFMMIGLCMVLRAAFGELKKRQRVVRMVFAMLLMLLFKPYVLFCLVPVLIIFWLSETVFRGSWIKAFLAVTLAGLIVVMLFPAKRQRAVESLTRKQYDFINVGQGGMHVFADTCFLFFRPDQLVHFNLIDDSVVVLKEPVLAKHVMMGRAEPFRDVWLKPDGTEWISYYYMPVCPSYIEITSINNSVPQLMKNSPEAFVNAAFRPFFGDPGNSLKYFALAETLVLFGWLAWQARRWRSVPNETRRIILTLLLFSVLLFLVIGWITPVLGAIVRYRIPAYFALLVTGILMWSKRTDGKVDLHSAVAEKTTK